METEEKNPRSGLFINSEPIGTVRHRHELYLSAGDDKGDARDDAGKDDAGKDDSRTDRGDDSGDDSGDAKDDSGGDDSRDDR